MSPLASEPPHPARSARCHTAPGVTIIELVVVLAALIILGTTVFLVPLGSGCRRPARQMQNNTQLRGIHQGMVIHAQSNKIRKTAGYYPGLDKQGKPTNRNVQHRYKVMLDQNLFTPQYIINPREKKTAWSTGPVTTKHYSYAMLQLPKTGGRHDEWKETLNPEAIVLSDRNIAAPQQPLSVFSQTNSQNPTWRGGVAYNDNHVNFRTTHRLDTVYAGDQYKDDHLFRRAGPDDAFMIFSGN